MLEKGLVQIYTGDGKGKTTAALGLALRAAAQGNRVLFYQFLKGPSVETGERLQSAGEALGIHFQGIDLQWDMARSPGNHDQVVNMRKAIAAAMSGLADAAREARYDLIVLDEIVFCLAKGLVTLADVKNCVEGRDRRVEIVMTGRGADQKLIDMGDLVTEMKNIKHPFDGGQKARKGIEY